MCLFIFAYTSVPSRDIFRLPTSASIYCEGNKRVVRGEALARGVIYCAWRSCDTFHYLEEAIREVTAEIMMATTTVMMLMMAMLRMVI